MKHNKFGIISIYKHMSFIFAFMHISSTSLRGYMKRRGSTDKYKPFSYSPSDMEFDILYSNAILYAEYNEEMLIEYKAYLKDRESKPAVKADEIIHIYKHPSFTYKYTRITENVLEGFKINHLGKSVKFVYTKENSGEIFAFLHSEIKANYLKNSN